MHVVQLTHVPYVPVWIRSCREHIGLSERSQICQIQVQKERADVKIRALTEVSLGFVLAFVSSALRGGAQSAATEAQMQRLHRPDVCVCVSFIFATFCLRVLFCHAILAVKLFGFELNTFSTPDSDGL